MAIYRLQQVLMLRTLCAKFFSCLKLDTRLIKQGACVADTDLEAELQFFECPILY